MPEQPIITMPESVDPLLFADVCELVRTRYGRCDVVYATGKRGLVIEVYGAKLGAMPGQQAVA